MPKVLRIINRFNLGGPTYNAAYLSKYLSKDYDTLLVGGIKDQAEGSSEFIVDNLGLHPIIIPEMRRSLNPANDLIAYRKLTKLIRKYKPDIVHTHASKAGTLGRLAAIRNNVPVILHTFHGHVFHSYFGSSTTGFIINIEQGLAEKTTKIIAISDKQKQELAYDFKIAPPEKFEVIPLGFDLTRFQIDNYQRRINFRKKYHIADNEVAIGIIGRLTAIKNHNLFIDAIKNINKKTRLPIRAFIIGDGEMRDELLNYSSKNGLSTAFCPNGNFKHATVTFTSWITEIENIYPGLDIVAMTSLNEGTPVSLIEAQAANKPIVTTNVGGIENIVIPNQTALLTRNNDINDLTEKLLQLVNNPVLRQQLAQNGWEHVRQKFHYTRLVNDMENLYNKLLYNQ